MKNNWRTINIFLSSTFSDMQAERDVVRKVVVPYLNEVLRPRQISVIVTDLRWGVDTAGVENESDREAKVLHVCINAINNTRPYFVALVGERYGWIPGSTQFGNVLNRLPDSERSVFGPSPCSVTEMEIMLGAIGDPKMLDNSVFCFRNPASYEGMSDVDFKRFVTGAQGKESLSKLNALKSKIMDACAREDCTPGRIVDYRCRWNAALQRFEDLDDFARSLQQRILSDVIGEDVSSVSVPRSDSDVFDNFFASNSHHFVGRSGKLSEVSGIVAAVLARDSSPLHGIVLSGPSGVGKSYFLSALAASLQSGSGLVTLTHAAGLTPASVRSESMLANWVTRLQELLHDDSSDFPSLVRRAKAKGYRIIALVDSLDSFALGDDPLSRIPDDVFVVATSLPDRAVQLINIHQTYVPVPLEQFDRDDAAVMIRRAFEANSKQLTADLLEAILTKRTPGGAPSYNSPLWLNLILSMLMELGDSDFRSIHNIGADASVSIRRYLLDTIDSLPGDTGGLFARFIDMSCFYFEPSLTIGALTYIALSPFGIAERQLETLIGDRWDSLQFESLRHWLGSNIRVDGDDRIVSFSHNILRKSLSESDDSRIADARMMLNQADCDDFINGIVTLDELVRRLIYRGEYDAMRRVVIYMDETLAGQGVYDFALAVFKVLQTDISTVVHFVDRYCSLFRDFGNYDTELYWVNELIEAVDRSDIAERDILMDEFSNVATRYFSTRKIFNGKTTVFGDYLAHEKNFDAWLWALDVNLRLYGPRILEYYSSSWACFGIPDARLVSLVPKVHDDQSRMTEFIDCFTQAIDIAERYKSMMPDKYGFVDRGLNTLKNYLTNNFIGWHYATHPFHQKQLELSARLDEVIAAPSAVTELPPSLKPAQQEVDDAVMEYDRLFSPSAVMTVEPVVMGVGHQLAIAELYAALGNRDEALKAIDDISPDDKFSPMVIEWLSSRYPDAGLMRTFWSGRVTRIMADILLGKQADTKELSRIVRLYCTSGQRDDARRILMLESEILFMHQMDINFAYDDCTYEHNGNYIFTLDNVAAPYKALVAELIEFGFVSDAEVALRRWMEMCDLTFVDLPRKASDDYRWGEAMLDRLGCDIPPRKYPVVQLDDRIRDLIKMRLKEAFPNYETKLCDFAKCDDSDILIILFKVGYGTQFALFDSSGEPLTNIEDGYKRIVNFGADEISLAGDPSFCWEFLRRDGKRPFEGRFESAHKFSEGLAAVPGLKRADYPRRYYWGFIDTGGNEVIPKIYEEVGDFHSGRAWAVKDGRYGVIDREGNVVADFDYDVISPFYRGKAYAFRDNKMITLDLTAS